LVDGCYRFGITIRLNVCTLSPCAVERNGQAVREQTSACLCLKQPESIAAGG